jgi:hypothetical protein
MVHTCTPFQKWYNGFQFRAWWIDTQGFMELLQQSWEHPMSSLNKARALHIKLAPLAKALQKWSKAHLAKLRQESTDASQLVLQLDQQQGTRQLTDMEMQQRRTAKNKILGLPAVRKIRLQQCSRLTWIRARDTNTKLFHL